MVKICPVSDKQTNENVSRMNAFFTVVLVAAGIYARNFYFPLILTFDFLLRNIMEGRLSPVIHINRYMAGVLSVRQRMINAGPKIFSARVGLFLSSLSFVLALVSTTGAAMVPLGILGIFSFLEMACGYCVACKLYPYFLPLNEKIARWFR
jgi:hypothetical protein